MARTLERIPAIGTGFARLSANDRKRLCPLCSSYQIQAAHG
ncbi:hypothetical protein B4113_3222 [Geobacillus sp. B4113_201601]|nr:hypothetical protein B4113_3222 [Geobacillus sp. B4113_201601]